MRAVACDDGREGREILETGLSETVYGPAHGML